MVSTILLYGVNHWWYVSSLTSNLLPKWQTIATKFNGWAQPCESEQTSSASSCMGNSTGISSLLPPLWYMNLHHKVLRYICMREGLRSNDHLLRWTISTGGIWSTLSVLWASCWHWQEEQYHGLSLASFSLQHRQQNILLCTDSCQLISITILSHLFENASRHCLRVKLEARPLRSEQWVLTPLAWGGGEEGRERTD